MKKYTKIEVAIKLLLQSKELFLLGDYVASTVLAGAGQQILRDIAESRGIEPTIQTISNVSGHSRRKIHDLGNLCKTLTTIPANEREQNRLAPYFGL